MEWRRRSTLGIGLTALALVGVWGGWAIFGKTTSASSFTAVPPDAEVMEITAGANETNATENPSATNTPSESPDTPVESPPVSPSANTMAAPPQTLPKELVVHVTGAVKRPGVYTLKPGDRIYHAVRAAGGLKPNAQTDALNQADFVQDADQIHFPSRDEKAQRTATGTGTASASRTRPLIVRGRPPVASVSVPPAFVPYTKPYKPASAGAPVPIAEPSSVEPVVVRAPVPVAPSAGRVLGKEPAPVTTTAASETPPANTEEDAGPDLTVPEFTETVAPTKTKRSSSRSSGSSAKFKNPGDGVVNINTAGAAELQKLPGVGPAMSSRILEYRQKIGRFKDASQLMDVKGIGTKTFEKMRSFVSVQ